MIFPKSEYNILKLIYETPGIRLTELIKKAKVSSSTAKKRLDHLFNSGIINEEKITGGNRIILKTFYPNLLSDEGINVFSLIESIKKQEFFISNKNLVGPFKQLLMNIDKNIKIIIVFGSFANYSRTKDSDLDLLFLVSKKINENQLKKEIERSFVTFDHEVSPRIDSLTNFNKNINKDIYQSIIKNHIIIKGGSDYIGVIELNRS